MRFRRPCSRTIACGVSTVWTGRSTGCWFDRVAGSRCWFWPTLFRPVDGLIVHTGGHARQAEIEKGLREASPLLASDLGRFFGMPLVVVEPSRRLIGLLGARPAREADRWFEV